MTAMVQGPVLTIEKQRDGALLTVITAGGILGIITHSEVIGQSRLVLAVQLSIATTSTRYTHTVPRI